MNAPTSWREKRRLARAERRDRLNARAKTSVPKAPPREESGPAPFVWFLGASLAAHPAVVVALTLLPHSDEGPHAYQPIEVQISDPDKPLAAEEKKPAPPPEKAPPAAA